MVNSIKINREEVISLLKDMVSINSVNPNIEGGPGEIELSNLIAEYLEKIGLEVHTQDVVDGRFNVMGILKGSGGGRSLMFNGHTDTVGVRNMTIDPFKPLIENDRLHGRGACDMKGSLTAMMIALKTLVESDINLKGDVLLSAVVGEEYDNVGTKKLISEYRFSKLPDAVIVGEPTSLQLAIKHKGFANIELETEGKAAHGSVPEKGIDAIEKMAKIIVKLDNLKKACGARKNDLLGTPKMHMSTIEGGREWSVVPDRCLLRLEIRTIPEYTSDKAIEDIREIIEELSSKDPDLKATIKLFLAGEPLDTSPDEPVVEALQWAVRKVKGTEPQILGMPYYTEAALFVGELGTPACLIGAGDIKQAHAADEFVEVSEVVDAAAIYALTAQNFSSA